MREFRRTSFSAPSVHCFVAYVSQLCKFSIPAKLFAAEVKALPAEIREVELSFSGKTVSVNGRCEIRTADADEFPLLPSDFDKTVKVRGMTEAFSRVITAVSRDETRFVLTGVMLDLAKGKTVGTDGFRLHWDDIESEGGPALIVPASAVKIFLKFRGEDTVRLPAPEAKHVAFSVAGGLLTARLMEGNFPDYEQVIPAPQVTVTFAASEFLKLIEGAMPLANQSVQLTINGELIIYSAGEQGKYEWRIPCEVNGATKELVYTFNPAYLIDAIRAYPADRVLLGTQDGQYGPCLINGKALVMSIRV
jgi:DNA polymerase III subunit beta